MSVQIRLAATDDIPDVHRLGQGIEEFAVNSEQTVNFWPQDVLLSAASSNDVLILVAYEDKTLVGFVISSLNHGLRKALIENIYVVPEKRGQGVGDQLLRELLTRIKEQGCEYVATLVSSHTPAVDLYLRNGFAQGEQFLWLDQSLTGTFRTQPNK